jgi:hypothetical protein
VALAEDYSVTELPRTFTPRREPEDFCSKDGALKLAEMIQAYWSERGGVVETQLIERTFTQTMRSTRFDVRTDMLNGRPRLRVVAPSPEADT